MPSNFGVARTNFCSPKLWVPASAFVSTTTWNPSDKDAGISLSNGNLTATGSSGQVDRSVRATTAITGTDKKYWEVQFTTLGGSSDDGIGFANLTALLSGWIGDSADSVGNFKSDANVYNNGASIGAPSNTWTVNDVVGIAVDFAAKLVWVRVGSGVWNAGGTANPATGVGGFTFATTGNIYPALTFGDTTGTGVATANFGATAFANAAPSGYTGL